ncbi:hypothetical protein BT93_H1324 [Corymbia citriodora subsp. variegata]|nr:hypothetical protein BT93_H1324 [Corymbia citriodora subsp. variegata]
MLRNIPPTSPKHSIFRVRHHLREVNKKAYDPEILAIGPYHHGNDKFRFMEEQKLRYLRQLLERTNEGSINSYMLALRKLEEQARNCYAEAFNSFQEDFLAMMLIDGCFIVEFFRKCINKKLRDRDKDDPIMHGCGIRTSIRRDLLLLENQLPLFVLSKLYDLTKGPNEIQEFSDVAATYFKFKPGTIGKSQGDHLLHLYHTWGTSGLPKTPSATELDCIPELVCIPAVSSATEIGRIPSATELDCIPELGRTPSATELRESGVSFRALQGGELSDIKFENGTLKIPVLYVEDSTESQFRNLIAYEQYRQSRGINYFTDYTAFMDCLINSSKGVKVLRRARIIKNYLGDDEVVAQMFNKIGDHVTVSDFYYSEVFTKVNAYYTEPWNIWVTILRTEYFNTPWIFLSGSAAGVLLLLTIAQTVFSILSYTKQS